LREALSQRRMVRSFDGRPVDPDVLEGLCAESLRAPTAGNAAGVSMAVVPPDLVAAFFDAATDEAWRASAPRADGLARAGAAVIVTSDPAAYLRRYGEGDKSGSGLSVESAWPVPYWHTDAAMATMALLLLLEESRLQATLWGAFRREQQILDFAGAPRHERLFASVIVGHGDGRDRRSASLDRATPARVDRVRRVGVQ